MDDREQLNRRYYLYRARWYKRGECDDWRQRQDRRYLARREDFRAAIQKRFKAIQTEFFRVEATLREVLKTQALLLNQLDHQLAELAGQPSPNPVQHPSFVGKYSLRGPAHEAFCDRKRRTRKVLNRHGYWWNMTFPTLEEAEAFDREQAEKKAKKQAEQRAKQMVRMQRWLDERLGVEKTD